MRVTIPVSSTGGEVLAVPAAALSATAAGDTILQVEEDSTLRTVTIEPGLAAGGLVEVTPIEGDLAEGDWVVVGREGASDSTGEDETGSTTPAETTDTTEPTDTTDGEA